MSTKIEQQLKTWLPRSSRHAVHQPTALKAVPYVDVGLRGILAVVAAVE